MSTLCELKLNMSKRFNYNIQHKMNIVLHKLSIQQKNAKTTIVKHVLNVINEILVQPSNSLPVNSFILSPSPILSIV